MAHIKPFRALRPYREYVSRVASCAYDVIEYDEALRIAERNELTFLRVSRSEIDLPHDTDPYDIRVYEKAKENLSALREKKIMFQEREPCFYVYRQALAGHVQEGIVACVSIDEYLSGTIKKHELTRADKEADRTRHFATVNAQTGPVFLAYRSSDIINQVVDSVVKTTPEYDFEADDSIRHTAWVIRDARTIDAVRNAFENVGSMYIADGHHRAASAAAIALLRRANNPGFTGDEEYNSMLAVLFPHDRLNVLAYNRVVRDLNGLSVKDFMKRVSRNFHVSEAEKSGVAASIHHIGIYAAGKWYDCAVREKYLAGTTMVKTLDVSILHDYLLKPILRIGDVRRDERIGFVGGIKGMGALERCVDSGEYAVAFSLYPVTLEQLMAVSDSGEIMPPKSTWFEPKLRSGIFVHLLE